MSSLPNSAKPVWEVEQKYHVRDAQKLVKRLIELGFARRCEESHEDTYFQHPCRDFRQSDEALRLRRLNGHTMVTYKGKRMDAKVKTRPEIELALQTREYSQWRRLLEELGFAALQIVRKRRQVFERSSKASHDGPPQESVAGWDPVISVDDVQGLGQFAEIELIVSEQESLKSAQGEIERLAARLELSEVQPLSYLSQILANETGLRSTPDRG